MHYVHRLVVRAFIGEIESGQEINHLDGDADNNAIANLEVVSHSQNMKHAVHVIKTVKPPLNLSMQGRAPWRRNDNSH